MGLFAKLIGKSTPSPTTTTGPQETRKNEYRGVEVIAANGDCCQAAQAIAGQRFLTNQLPMLPLNGCDAADCQCRYERFDDRRTDVRRASDVSFDMASQLVDHDIRTSTSSGRRADD